MGPLTFNLHRTVRVKVEETSNLPPSLGNFVIHKVKDFKCPETWDKDAYFIAMHSQEAMWISFQTVEPVAIMIRAGNINAINGKEFKIELEKNGYLVTPPQPWLDGWKGDDGSVYQFVATEVRENKTVGEQLIETKEHAIIISAFKAKNPEKLHSSRPHEEWFGGSKEDYWMPIKCCAFGESSCNMPQYALGNANLCNEMGLGKGGKIIQKIYEDPHGIEEWEEKPIKTIKIYLINASEFGEITGQALPEPVTSESYDGIWYGLKDKQIKDVPGTTVFDKLKSAI